MKFTAFSDVSNWEIYKRKILWQKERNHAFNKEKKIRFKKKKEKENTFSTKKKSKTQEKKMEIMLTTKKK